ncbi:hypothetical protein [Saccharibacillus sacchari]|uniref:hypothetical protein n=1 Tax=Saccharibacillus sacchari TaxID=456493 RepID=UPI0004B7E4D2|nr:hypothetical protein [Saccharibacillus sacchari]
MDLMMGLPQFKGERYRSCTDFPPPLDGFGKEKGFILVKNGTGSVKDMEECLHL